MALALMMIVPEYLSSSAPPPIKGGRAKEKNQESPPPAVPTPRTRRPIRPPPNWVVDTFLLFEKTLENDDIVPFSPRLVIRSCKDEVKEALDSRLKDKDPEAYVWASAIDGKGRTYNLRVSRFENEKGWSCYINNEWGNVIKNNGLKAGDKIWCWGRILQNSWIQMKIDVDRA